jgi:hypothetical protein
MLDKNSALVAECPAGRNWQPRVQVVNSIEISWVRGLTATTLTAAWRQGSLWYVGRSSSTVLADLCHKVC